MQPSIEVLNTTVNIAIFKTISSAQNSHFKQTYFKPNLGKRGKQEVKNRPNLLFLAFVSILPVNSKSRCSPVL